HTTLFRVGPAKTRSLPSLTDKRYPLPSPLGTRSNASTNSPEGDSGSAIEYARVKGWRSPTGSLSETHWPGLKEIFDSRGISVSSWTVGDSIRARITLARCVGSAMWRETWRGRSGWGTRIRTSVDRSRVLNSPLAIK